LALRPISRRELIARLKRIGFTGPLTGGRHEHMVRGTTRATLPNPHGGDISKDLLAIFLRQAGISRDEWEATA
jgi:predicted RNA binding protein YcfA (HicA-like mRNA interferase family)